MLAARLRPRAVVLASGRVMVAGGDGPYDDSNPAVSVEIYDPATDAWTAHEPPGDFLFPGRSLFLHGGKTPTMITLTRLADDRVMLTGSNAAGDCGRAMLYDEASDTWTETAKLPVPVAVTGSLLLPDGRMIVAGGMTCVDDDRKDGVKSSNVEAFDSKTGTWTLLASTHHPRWFADLTWMGCQGVVATDSYQYGLSDYELEHEIYDIATDQWTVVPKPPKGGGAPGCQPQSLRDGAVLCTGPMMTLGP
jgi:hypothetical protein